MTSSSFISKEARPYPLVWLVAAAVFPVLLGTLLIGLVLGDWWHLAGYFWYFMPGSFLPQDPAVIYAGTVYNPGLVVLLFGLTTVTASVVDYCILRRVLGIEKLEPLRQTSFYQAAVRCFYWRPWWTIVVFAFTPLPYFPVRVLALSSKYPLIPYVSANLAGRLPRYYLLAIGGAWVAIPLTYLLLMGFAMSLVPCIAMLWLRRKPALA